MYSVSKELLEGINLVSNKIRNLRTKKVEASHVELANRHFLRVHKITTDFKTASENSPLLDGKNLS